MRSTPPVMKMDYRWSAERAKARTGCFFFSLFCKVTSTARHTKRDNNSCYSSAVVRAWRVSASVNHFVALGRRLKFPSITLVVAQASTQPTDYVTCSPNHAVLLSIRRLSAICRRVCRLSACCCCCPPALLSSTHMTSYHYCVYFTIAVAVAIAFENAAAAAVGCRQYAATAQRSGCRHCTAARNLVVVYFWG